MTYVQESKTNRLSLSLRDLGIDENTSYGLRGHNDRRAAEPDQVFAWKGSQSSCCKLPHKYHGYLLSLRQARLNSFLYSDGSLSTVSLLRSNAIAYCLEASHHSKPSF